jgi:RimJ/RimL family protein N-acetyltransferase
MNAASLFTGKQIELTSLNPEKDAETLSLWSADQEFVKLFMGGVFRPYSTEEMKKLFGEKLNKANESQNAYHFALRQLGTEELIGLLVFDWIWSSQQVARVSLYFAEKAALAQYGTEALQMGLRFGFMELSLHRMWTELSDHQPQLMAAFEGAGFLREVQRAEALYFDGRYYDQLGYALLKPEWKKLQEVKNEA